MRITVVGAGNVGTQIAVHGAEKGHEVMVYTSKPQRICKKLFIFNEEGKVSHQGVIAGSTSDPERAFRDAEVVFVTVPAFCMKEMAECIVPWVHKGMTVCLVPGIGGGEHAFFACRRKGAVICGLQRVPSVARLIHYGESVAAIGYRKALFAAALPAGEGRRCAEMLSALFDMSCTVLPHYLNVTLTPSNPLLHTVRCKTLFGDFHPGKIYSEVPLFYEEWTDETSELLLTCDEEVQGLCRALSPLDLSFVRSLREHYESTTPQALTRKIRSIQGFKGLTSPVLRQGQGFVPDFESRYFRADFPYGLHILCEIAALAGHPVPTLTLLYDWYVSLAHPQTQFSFADYGIYSAEDLFRCYA